MEDEICSEELYSIEKSFDDSMQSSLPQKMFISCIASSIIGIIVMAILGDALMISIHVVILMSTNLGAFLFVKKRISTETACLIPMLLLCFVFTPVSWVLYDGLIGYTPYLSIMFAIIITISYYQKIQTLLLGLYSALLFILSFLWLYAHHEEHPINLLATSVLGYTVTYASMIYYMIATKKKSIEINRGILDTSIKDELTGLYNRHGSLRILDLEEKRFAELGADYIIMMLDIDHFKQINDMHGHVIGDAVLRRLAVSILDTVRASDYAIRYGGDEFLILLANAKRDVSHLVIDRIESSIHKIPDFPFSVTVSIGMALRSECESVSDLIVLADKRMYEDKETRHPFDKKQTDVPSDVL